MELYAITDRRLFGGGERERRAALLAQAERWLAGGVRLLQLREKDLEAFALERLAGELVALAAAYPGAQVLVNGAAPLAAGVGAHGVHLPGSAHAELARAIEDARAAFGRRRAVLSIACHTAEEARRAGAAGADVLVFAPVFEKLLLPERGTAGNRLPGVGLPALTEACRAAAPVPVFALGGVTVENAALCVAAGAAGIAGIRLFAGEGWTAFSSTQEA